MLRATMTQPGRIEFEDVPKPVVKDGEVLLRIKRIGICGSDVHVFHGKHPYTSYPVVQGHEFCGEVAEIGSGVTSVRVGDLVTAPPQVVCGICPLCREGRYHICDNLKVIGFQAPGVAQEFFIFPEAALIKVPDHFTPELGALVEPTAVAVHAVARAGRVEGERVLVLGAGPIGNLVAQVARWRGAANLVITDLSDYRLDIARACGIGHTLNSSRVPAGEGLAELLGSERPGVVFECVGAGATVNDAIRCVKKGGTIVIVGVFGARPEVDFGLIQDRELQIRGTLMYQRDDYLEAIRGISEGKIVTGPLVTRSFRFRDFLDAYGFIEAHRDKAMKVMVNVND